MSSFLNIFSLNNFAFFLVLVGVFLVSYKYGRKLSVSLILAAYPTILIANNLDFIQTESITTTAIFVGIVYIFSMFLLWNHLDPHDSYGTSRKVFDYAVLSAAFIILLSSVMANSLTVLNSFIELGSFSNLITENIPYGFALLIPLIAIVITNKRARY